MKVALIGVGQAGGNVTERLAQFDADMGFGAVQGALAINSAEADLHSLEFVDTLLIGADRVNGHGVGADNELGAEIMQADIQQVVNALDGRVTSRADAIFVVAGLGGGTGSGGSPALVHHLQQIYDVPVYALGILPGRNEGALYQANAGRSLKTLAREADSTLLIDNDSWHEQGESVEDAFDRINGKIAQRVGLLFASGEAVDGVGESVVDSSEVINTFRAGGISVLGYASEIAAEEASENLRTVMSVSRQALLTGTSLPDATRADAALLVIAGKPEAVPRKGVEKARRWLEEETDSMQVRGGDFPLESDRLGALVLLGGAERSSRLDEFMERAREAKRAQEDEGDREDPADALTDDRLEGLF
ncbi:tubulin/FtsZ family protein [Natrarchaeobaculum aegyptiacum]|uniref:Tubulin-like protein CetZ n=1 Tax=Natrarchaeobaculum aegyptiacum TaxID=745377 RepID=A0A2Z2I1C8_9EURY|nr:tubulin/FtsZ family protein [Natrarchaeobaculum aegyptiacum]ARS90228.1 cell division protein [Natrarchaeobaculum aegyptiacum]